MAIVPRIPNILLKNGGFHADYLAHAQTAPPYVFRWGLDYWDSKLWSARRIDTAPLGEELVPRFPGQGIVGGMSGGLPTGLPVAVPLTSLPDAFQFRRIGHCLAAIMFGLIGMVVGRLTAAEDGRSEHA